MQFADIEVGKLYGIREGRASLTDRPIHKVKVVAKLDDKKRPKVRYLEGVREGLEEFARTVQFVAKWADVKRVLRDEASLETLRVANAEFLNDVVWEAISAVIFSTGENTMVPMESPNRIEIPTFDIKRIEERFDLEPLKSSHRAAFVDREGILHLPFEAAESLAKHIAHSEPDAVLLYIQQHEDEMLAAGYQPGMRHRHHMLREHQPAYALARQWAGFQGKADLLTREIERLRKILIQTVWTLRQNGADNEARRLERAIEGR
jgi:hypothetical protein